MSNDSKTTERDELARELFIADNSNQPREASLMDWEWFEGADKQRGQVEHYRNMAAGMIAAGYAKVDHIEYAADHKYAGLEFTDEDDELYTDRATFERDFEDFHNATLMQRHVGPWVPLEPEAEALVDWEVALHITAGTTYAHGIADGLITKGYRKLDPTDEAVIDKVAATLAKADGWLSLTHPSPRHQTLLRERARPILTVLHEPEAEATR